MTSHPATGEVRLQKIVSGGQTGVDRAALDAAMAAGVAVGGWCPKGRRAEDGRIDERYPLVETDTDEYDERTRRNVRDSDATLILAPGEPPGGTAVTLEEARRLERPWLIADPYLEGTEPVRRWLAEHAFETLNVAGPRESTHPGIYDAATAFMRDLLKETDLRPET